MESNKQRIIQDHKKLTKEIKEYVERSVLCWLATSFENIPNVSPKEAFMTYKNDSIIIANIASPQSMKNIERNENVCLSFIDAFVQKGFQLKGKAKIVTKKDAEFLKMKKKLEELTLGKFPYSSITRVFVKEVKKVIAPSYFLFPNTTEAQQIENAKKAYGIKIFNKKSP